MLFFFQLKDLKNIRPEEPATFFVVFVLFFYESREKRSGLNIETKKNIRPDSPPPHRPRVSRCVVFITWQSLVIQSFIGKRIFKYYR